MPDLPMPEGEWVRYEDYQAALQDREAELLEQTRRAEEEIRKLEDAYDRVIERERERANRAEAALLEIRDTPVEGADVEWIAWAGEVAATSLSASDTSSAKGSDR